MTKKRVIEVMNDQKTTFNNAAASPEDAYRRSWADLFSARKELGDENPDDARRTAQARVDAVNYRTHILGRS